MSDLASPDRPSGFRAPRGGYADPLAHAEPPAERRDADAGWWRLAGVGWVGAVMAFVWGRYGLSFGASAFAEARNIPLSDWMLILAAVLGPLLVLAAAASMWRRSRQLSDESRLMAQAAMRMAEGARAIRPAAPLGAALMGEVEGVSPANIRREVERATHAIGALHQQMRAIEEALAAQSAALDSAAERAEARARAITESLKAEREALQSLVKAIEDDGGRALSLVSMRPGDMEKTQKALEALKSQSDAIERTVEQAGHRLNAIAADIQQALRSLKAAAPESVADPEAIRASIQSAARNAAHEAIGAIGEIEAQRARLTEAGAMPGLDDEAAEARRRNLSELRRQVDRLRNLEPTAPATPRLAPAPLEDARPAPLAAPEAAVEPEGFEVVSPRDDLSIPSPGAAPDILKGWSEGDFDPDLVDPEPLDADARPARAAAPAAAETAAPASSTGRGWLGAARPEGPPATGFAPGLSERREIEGAALEAPEPPPVAPRPPRPAIVWRQPDQPLGGDRAIPRPRPLDWEKVVIGLNFPVSETDREAEEALYHVSVDHQVGALIQSSEDILAVLVDLRLYMEDHEPQCGSADRWRDWLDGRAVGAGGAPVGIGPQEAVEKVRALIDQDPAVERLAVSFAARFEDLMRRALDEGADSSLIARLINTRTGRAYAMVAKAGDGAAGR